MGTRRWCCVCGVARSVHSLPTLIIRCFETEFGRSNTTARELHATDPSTHPPAHPPTSHSCTRMSLLCVCLSNSRAVCVCVCVCVCARDVARSSHSLPTLIIRCFGILFGCSNTAADHHITSTHTHTRSPTQPPFHTHVNTYHVSVCALQWYRMCALWNAVHALAFHPLL
jgi:hypothetical protein